MVRSPTRRAATVATAVAAALCADPAVAVTVDGVLDLEYGPPLAVQTTQTSFEDSSPGLSPDPVRIANGSELDALYAFVDGNVLRLMLAGNLGFCCSASYSHQEVLDVFIDSQPGGQSTLRNDNPLVGWAGTALMGLAGLSFDLGFEPDYWLGCTINTYSSYAELPAAGRGEAYNLGSNLVGAPGVLTNGINPFGILIAVDNSNAAGVGTGCAPASGARVTTGIEWAIPLAAIGNPTGCFRVCALVNDVDTYEIGNQVLGPLPPGTCALGAPESVHLASHAGNQYVSVCPAGSEAKTSTWGQLKTVYR